jgi:phosphoesterase RecJ-like protein
MVLSELVKIAKGYKTIHLVGHIHPDGDCIGSTLGLAMLFEKYQIPCRVLLLDPPMHYGNLPIERWVDCDVPETTELLIALDSSDLERLGDFGVLVEKATKVINIDHHFSNTLFGDINLVEGEASSTSEIIFNMIDDFEVLDAAIAEVLYLGIIYDTGAFKHSNTKPSTHIAASKLISYGIDFTEMINKMFFEKPFKSMKAQGLAYARLMLLEEDRVAVSYLNMDDYETLGITKAHTDSIVQYMNEIEGISAAVFFYAVDAETYKVSLRSKGAVDVCRVAQAFNGGGHIKASGASFKGTIDGAIESVVEAIALQL